MIGETFQQKDRNCKKETYENDRNGNTVLEMKYSLYKWSSRLDTEKISKLKVRLKDII